MSFGDKGVLGNIERAELRYKHLWRVPTLKHGVHVEECVCGVLRNSDGSNDDAICGLAVERRLAERVAP
jgi:hypothetical protein